MSVYQTLKFILNHPLNADSKYLALQRFLRWQIGSRLVPGAVAVEFVNSSQLLVRPGMTGATGNVYCGLHEFEDMAFLLHLLRPDDLFVDVGANIGSYTVLAGAAIGARCISVEPLPDTYRHLQHNIWLNGLKELVKAHNIGLGKEDGTLHFTTSQDTVNHVARSDEIDHGTTLVVKVSSLDTILVDDQPKLIKIDVEGFESNVIAGGSNTLSCENLDAVIMELNGSGERYGFDEVVIHKQMLEYGFSTFSYLPFDRKLVPLSGTNSQAGNTLYIRNIEQVKKGLISAPKFRVFHYAI